MIDFHCHLDLYPDPAHVADECRRRGLYVLSVTTTPSAWHGTRLLSGSGGRIRTALGLHPQLAHERRGELPLFDELITDTQYVGEVGLDGTPDYRPHWEAQLDVFDHVLRTCRSVGGRIISIHSRQAAAEVLNRLDHHGPIGTPVLHWFSSNRKDLDRAIAMGCWFSVGPAMLRSERGRRLVERMPRNRVLTESDGPFAQVDGIPLFPWSVQQAITELAALWQLSSNEANTTLLANLRQLVSTEAHHAKSELSS